VAVTHSIAAAEASPINPRATSSIGSTHDAVVAPTAAAVLLPAAVQGMPVSAVAADHKNRPTTITLKTTRMSAAAAGTKGWVQVLRTQEALATKLDHPHLSKVRAARKPIDGLNVMCMTAQARALTL
jgi:hypothetical protein